MLGFGFVPCANLWAFYGIVIPAVIHIAHDSNGELRHCPGFCSYAGHNCGITAHHAHVYGSASVCAAARGDIENLAVGAVVFVAAAPQYIIAKGSLPKH